jgi:hypothetical protein
MDTVKGINKNFTGSGIVNGIARVDIFDAKGALLVKKGTKVREVHYQRMRDEGLIRPNELDAKHAPNKLNIDYSPPNSIHSRLNWLKSTFSALQKQIISQPEGEIRVDLNYICDTLIKLCEKSYYQVLGELYLSDSRFYSYVKPLYIAASLYELIKRYNEYNPNHQIDDQKKRNLLLAALLHNLGLLVSQHSVYSNRKKPSQEQRNESKRYYPQASALMAEKIGINEIDILQAIKEHNIESGQTQLEVQLLRMPFVFTGIAMREYSEFESMDIINPTREFARLFSENKLDPILGGLFLKINGLAPVGSILVFDSGEKAVVISGPGEENIASSTLRMITYKTGIQLGQPGEKFRLDQTSLKQKGMSNHHEFSWSKFSPFAVWEK